MKTNATHRPDHAHGAPDAGARTAAPDDALQTELRREEGEGAGLGGDVATDRTLTGSSTWATLPDPAPDAGGAGAAGAP